MPFCLHCGQKLDSEANYCGICGSPSYILPDAQSSTATNAKLEPPQPIPVSEPQQPKPSKSNGESWIGAFIAIAICVWAFWPSPDASNENNTSLIVDPTTAPPTYTVPAITTNPVSITGSLSPTQSSSQSISRSYKWTFKGSEWTWELSLPQALYDYYKGLPRSPTSNYSIYVTHPNDDLYIESLVNGIKEAAKNKGYSEFDTIEFAASFVQSLPYTSDNVTTKFDEYPRYPIETLVDNGGDCEDTSILMASMVESMGYGIVLLEFDPVAGSTSGHLAVGIKGGDNINGSYWEYAGNKYFYLETTNVNWSIGEIPSEYKTASAHIYDMIPVPILTHTWTSKGRVSYSDLTVVITNLGSAEASGVYVWAAYDAGNNSGWNSEQSSTFNLGIGQTATVTISIKAPADQHTRIHVQIVYGGYAVDQSYSDWFDT